MVVIGSPSSSGSGASTARGVNGNSWPCWPPQFFRTASLVLVTLPLSDLSPRQASTRSLALSLAPEPRVPEFDILAEVIDTEHETTKR